MTHPKLAQYLHQCFCPPPKVTLLNAIKNKKLRSVPGLTHDLISKHLPEATTTAKGHMKRVHQGTQSTHNNQQNIINTRKELTNMNPAQEACSAHDMFVCAAIADKNSGTMYTNLPGPFPLCPFKNMYYIFVACMYDSNAILVRPMAKRTTECMKAAFKDIIDYLHQK